MIYEAIDRWNNPNTYLEHFGVKGMKWGVRHKKKSNSLKRKSEHFKVISRGFRDDGYSKADAERKARNRIIAERVLLGIGIATVAAAGIYVAHNAYVKKYSGETIRAGTLMQRIVSQRKSGYKLEVPNVGESFSKPFYSSFTKGDNAVYAGVLAGKDIRYKCTLSPTTDIKIASVNDSQKVFKNLLDTNSNFRNGVNKMLSGRKESVSSMYKEFNRGLVRSKNKQTADIFYNQMKQKGYSGIFDLEDRDVERLSKKPAIIFGNIGKIKVTDVNKISLNVERNKGRNGLYSKGVRQYYKYMTESSAGVYSMQLGAGFVSGAGLMAIDDYSKNENNGVKK